MDFVSFSLQRLFATGGHVLRQTGGILRHYETLLILLLAKSRRSVGTFRGLPCFPPRDMSDEMSSRSSILGREMATWALGWGGQVRTGFGLN